jgi:KDO2-lipid IV(A) lauroyltransferase
MSSKRKRLLNNLASTGFRFAERYFSHKSAEQSERAGERLGRIAARLQKRRIEIAKQNLGIAFPGMSEPEREALAKEVFVHFARVMADFMRSATRPSQEVLDTATVVGIEHIDNGLAAGKGVILVTGHFGNWERMANWLTLKGYKVSVIARDANDDDLNNDVLRLRKAAGLEVISRGNAARPVLSKLKKNEIVGILPDQNTADAFIPFFGKPCGTVLGPAVLAQRAGAPIVPTFCYRTDVGKYTIEFWEPLTPDPDYEDPISGMMRSVNATLEKAIRQHPEQYLWIHDRWKAARQRGLL